MDEEQRGVLDVDVGEILPTEKRPWLEDSKSGLLSGTTLRTAVRTALRTPRTALRGPRTAVRTALGTTFGVSRRQMDRRSLSAVFSLGPRIDVRLSGHGLGHLVVDRARHVWHGRGLFRVRRMALAPHHR